jgi:hypothetical protein
MKHATAEEPRWTPGGIPLGSVLACLLWLFLLFMLVLG